MTRASAAVDEPVTGRRRPAAGVAPRPERRELVALRPSGDPRRSTRGARDRRRPTVTSSQAAAAKSAGSYVASRRPRACPPARPTPRPHRFEWSAQPVGGFRKRSGQTHRHARTSTAHTPTRTASSVYYGYGLGVCVIKLPLLVGGVGPRGPFSFHSKRGGWGVARPRQTIAVRGTTVVPQFAVELRPTANPNRGRSGRIDRPTAVDHVPRRSRREAQCYESTAGLIGSSAADGGARTGVTDRFAELDVKPGRRTRRAAIHRPAEPRDVRCERIATGDCRGTVQRPPLGT